MKAAGQWACLSRAIDQHGQVIDVFLPARRDLAGRGGSSPGRYPRAPSRPRPPPTARPFTRRCSMSRPLGPAYRAAVRH